MTGTVVMKWPEPPCTLPWHISFVEHGQKVHINWFSSKPNVSIKFGAMHFIDLVPFIALNMIIIDLKHWSKFVVMPWTPCLTWHPNAWAHFLVMLIILWQQMSNLTWHPNTWAPLLVIPNTTTADIKVGLTCKCLSTFSSHAQHSWQQMSSWVDTQKPEVVPNIPWWQISKLGWWNGSAREPGGIRTAATLESDHRLPRRPYWQFSLLLDCTRSSPEQEYAQLVRWHMTD